MLMQDVHVWFDCVVGLTFPQLGGSPHSLAEVQVSFVSLRCLCFSCAKMARQLSFAQIVVFQPASCLFGSLKVAHAHGSLSCVSLQSIHEKGSSIGCLVSLGCRVYDLGPCRCRMIAMWQTLL